MDDLHDTVATYESVADRYRERHADRSVIAHLVDRFLESLADAGHDEGARILDAGCGPGWESATFAERGHDPVGVDLTPTFLRVAREEAPGVPLARMDMRHLGLESDAVDGVWACASFLHVPREDAPGTLGEFRRVLRDGGVLQLSVKRGEGEQVGAGYEGDDRLFTLYRSKELRELAEDAGFRVDRVDGDETWIQLTARG